MSMERSPVAHVPMAESGWWNYQYLGFWLFIIVLLLTDSWLLFLVCTRRTMRPHSSLAAAFLAHSCTWLSRAARIWCLHVIGDLVPLARPYMTKRSIAAYSRLDTRPKTEKIRDWTIEDRRSLTQFSDASLNTFIKVNSHNRYDSISLSTPRSPYQFDQNLWWICRITSLKSPSHIFR